MLRETVLYNGRRYYRFPDHVKNSKRRYFWSSYKRVGYLHRHVWEDAFGEIPEEHQIHHKDGNSLNNELVNLECLSRKEHFKQHREEGLFLRRRYPTVCCVSCKVKFKATGFRQKYCVECKPSRRIYKELAKNA